MTTLAQSERAQLCDLFERVGPDAPTLCEGWRTRDLAAHLVVRESNPLALPGMFVPRLEPLTRRLMDRQLAGGNWSALVDRVRRGPARATVSAIPGVDAAMNGLEFFIHHEDARRAEPRDWEPRALLLDHEAQIFGRSAMMARLALRKSPVGIVLENALDPESPVRLKAGGRTVTLVGKPSELALWLFGRTGVADVELIGEDDDVAAVSALVG